MWKIHIYQGHIGIVDGEGGSVASLPGGRGNPQTWRHANIIVEC